MNKQLDMYWYYGKYLLHCKPEAIDAGSDAISVYFMNKQPSFKHFERFNKFVYDAKVDLSAKQNCYG